MSEREEPGTGGARIVGLQRSGGGVPKIAVDSVEVRITGMEGDRQRHRRFHGGPMRALCLYSSERLEALSAEGHPVAFGRLGENVTIAGLPWGHLRSGIRLRLGPVEVEVTGYAAPCHQITDAFADGDFTRISQKRHPGWSRVYARIITEGRLAVGDPAALLEMAMHE